MAAGNVEGARIVVDVGDVGMHVVVVFCCQALSWFVGSQGSSWWWVLQVGDVVAGRCWVGGCGMKKEAVSLFVTM